MLYYVYVFINPNLNSIRLSVSLFLQWQLKSFQYPPENRWQQRKNKSNHIWISVGAWYSYPESAGGKVFCSYLRLLQKTSNDQCKYGRFDTFSEAYFQYISPEGWDEANLGWVSLESFVRSIWVPVVVPFRAFPTCRACTETSLVNTSDVLSMLTFATCSSWCRMTECDRMCMNMNMNTNLK